jgi:tape measure domain-containing protein
MYGLAEALLNVGTSVMQVAQTGKLLAGLAGGDEQRLKFIAKAYGDVMMKGRLMGQEALQFANAGIPIYKALAEMLNVSTAQVRVMMEEGKISAEQMAQALQKLGADRNIGGQLAENMKTVSGQLQRAKVLIDQIMLSLAGNELNEFVANIIRSFNDLLQLVSESSAFLKSLDESLGLVENTLKAVARMIPFIGEHLATLVNLMGLLNGTAGMTDEEKMAASLKEQAEAAKKDEEAKRQAAERQQAEFEMAQKELKMRYEAEAVRARADYESWVMSQNLNDAQKEQLMNQYDRLERIKEEKELRRQMIEDDRRAAEEEVNRQAEFKRRAFSQANKAGASFGAGSVGEYGFLRDLILGRRENSEELKIMRSQEQALRNIEDIAQDQLDALENLPVGAELPPIVPVGGP